MIRLHNFGPFFGLPDASPFCLKVDAYLRAASIPFEVVSGLENLRRAPKGKLPFIEDDGHVVADSSFIIEYLKKKHGDTLDAGLTPAQRATAHAFIKLMDENLYWCGVHARWMDPAVWPVIREKFFGSMRPPLRWIVPSIVRSGVRRSLHGHGLGRHSPAEILAIARRDLAALADFLGERQYFLGDRVTTLDVVAFAFLAEFILPPIQCEFTDLSRSFPNLVAFVERFRARYYPGT